MSSVVLLKEIKILFGAKRLNFCSKIERIMHINFHLMARGKKRRAEREALETIDNDKQYQQKQQQPQ